MEEYNINYVDTEIDIFKRVLFDEQVKVFFERLTKIYNDIAKSEEILKEKELKEAKPDLSKIEEKIKQLTESGIDIDDKNWWLSDELYSFNPYFGNLSLNSTFVVAFLTVSFNGIKLDINEFDFLRSRINVPKERTDGLLRIAMPVPMNLIEYYSIWSKNNKNLKKEIERAEKKYSSIRNETKKSVLKSQISFMKNNLERGNEMKKRIDFFETITEEQIKLISEALDEVKTAKRKFDDNKVLINEITNKYNALESTTYERSFIKLLEEGTTSISVNEVITRIFKTIFIRKFVGDDHTLPEDFSEKDLVSIDWNLVSWFMKFKEEDFKRLYNEIFSNFDLFYESLEEKVLKKK